MSLRLKRWLDQLDLREPRVLLVIGAVVVLCTGIVVLSWRLFFAAPSRPESLPVEAPAETAPATADLLSQTTPRPQPSLTGSDQPAPPLGETGPVGVPPGNSRELRLLFGAVDSDALVVERRRAEPTTDPAERARQALEALIAGSRKGYLSSIPEGTRLREVYRDHRGVFFVDLSRELRTQHPGGSSEELRTVHCLVGTLMANVPEARGVRLLLQGREEITLAGHVDISHPLSLDPSQLVADSWASP
jgi:hypothetical protein